jgi:hypothetical protein
VSAIGSMKMGTLKGTAKPTMLRLVGLNRSKGYPV